MFALGSEPDGCVVEFGDCELTCVTTTDDQRDDVHVVQTTHRLPVDVCDQMVLPQSCFHCLASRIHTLHKMMHCVIGRVSDVHANRFQVESESLRTFRYDDRRVFGFRTFRRSVATGT